jgi:nucleotide-binding universal stress UspA family protein
LSGACDRGSFMCDAGYELRVTHRCIRHDLGLPLPQVFEDMAAAHEIVLAFQRKASASTVGSKTVGPEAGERTLYRLARGDDHRGVTWFDPQSRVVWLCGSRFHRSGDADDAFPYFESLLKQGAVWPQPDDYEWLEEDRAARLAEALPEAAQELLAEARRRPNVEHRRVVGTGEVGVVVEVVETLEETYVATSVRVMADPIGLVVLLAAFYPNRDLVEWRFQARLPTRPLEPSELCMSILHI